MKKLIFSIACIFLIHTARAQKELLQSDENNKYVFYQVNEKPGMTADTLYQRALAFTGKSGVKHSGGSITAKGKVVVYGNSLLTKKQAGEVSYILIIDTKDQKYRYKFGDFVFKPYKLDRYGNMVTQPGVEMPLEKVWTKYSDKDTDAYLAQVGTYCKTTAAQLVQRMDRVQVLHKEPDAAKKVVTDKW